MSYILVTGAGKNIGREIALFLAKEGEDIALHYRENLSGAKLLQNEIKAMGKNCEIIYGDFSTKEGIETFSSLAVSTLNGIKGLVNNAGFYTTASLENTSLDLLEKTFFVNLFSPFYLIKSLAFDFMQEGGSIVNLGMCGLESQMATSYAIAYHMSKLALLSLTKSAAKSLAKRKISVNMVSPGYCESSVDLPKDLSNLPLKRVAMNREIAEAVYFFFKNSYVTGQNLEVAGGVRL